MVPRSAFGYRIKSHFHSYLDILEQYYLAATNPGIASLQSL